jgi:ABC-type antimicrobial peptide transport system permease subunit
MTVQSSSSSQPPARSEFVTILAWAFIVLSGFGVAMLLLQSVIASQLPFDDIRELFGTDPDAPSPMMQAMILRMPWLFLAPLVPALVALAASIGLLLRRNWARLLFIVLMALGIIWNLGGAVFGAFMFAVMLPMTGAPDMPAGSGMVMTAMTAVSVAVALALCLLFGWLIKRLISPEIRREFGAA